MFTYIIEITLICIYMYVCVCMCVFVYVCVRVCVRVCVCVRYAEMYSVSIRTCQVHIIHEHLQLQEVTILNRRVHKTTYSEYIVPTLHLDVILCCMFVFVTFNGFPQHI